MTRQQEKFIEPNIIVECDGEYFHTRLLSQDKKRTTRDFIIDSELEKQEMQVIRLWGEDIKSNLKWCMKLIQSKLVNRLLH